MKRTTDFGTVLVGVAAVFVFSACHLTKDDPEPQDPSPFLVESIELEGVTLEPAQVEVNKVLDQDGAADTSWRVRFELDGGDKATSLPVDKGTRESHQLMVKGTRSDGEEVYKKVTVTLGN